MSKNEPIISDLVIKALGDTVYNWTIRVENLTYPGTLFKSEEIKGTVKEAQEKCNKMIMTYLPVGYRVLLVRHGESK